ncbi:MAG: SIS domain-containing protein [Candidatus Sumerlaeia bacterium]
MAEWIHQHISEAADLFAGLRDDEFATGSITHIVEVVVERLRAGGKVLTCGNGGSASDAQHLSQELVGKYRAPRQSLPAICLNADGAALTCIGNDFGFDAIFSRQVEALANKGDVVMVFSTSGRSPNIVAALEAARARGATTVGLLGRNGGDAAKLCDYSVVVPHTESARIQEVHGLMLHLICEALDRAFKE